MVAGEEGGGGFVGGVLGGEFVAEGFGQEGGGEVFDLGAGLGKAGVITAKARFTFAPIISSVATMALPIVTITDKRMSSFSIIVRLNSLDKTVEI